MEILRFDESDAPAPKRKRPSKAWLALSLVAALMGVGTAFASSTININKHNLTPLGQGVATATTCDNQIDVTPIATLRLPAPSPTPTEDNLSTEETVANVPTFKLGSIRLDHVDATRNSETTGVGCGGIDFKIQVYKNIKQIDNTFKATQLTCGELNLSDVTIAQDSGASLDSRDFTCDSGTENGSIYFRVNQITSPKDDATFNVVLNASTDFDYITLVSTHYLPLDRS